MNTEIGAFDKVTNTVPVTFSENGVTHTRDVNAVLTEDGTYDEEGTSKRIEQVGMGVSAKIALGVIKNLPEPSPNSIDETDAA